MKKKLLFTVMIMLIYLIGKNIPLGYVMAESNKHLAFNIDNVARLMLSDDARTPSIFMLGLSPWMSSMILAKVVTVIRNPDLKREKSHEKRMTVVLTLLFSFVQAWVYLQTIKFKSSAYLSMTPIQVQLLTMLEMIAGSMIIIWMAQKNAVYGIGGPSAIILMNILLNIIGIVRDSILKVNVWNRLMIFAAVIVFIYCVLTVIISVIMSNSERRIPVYKTMIQSDLSDTSYLTFKVSPLGTTTIMYIMALFSMIKSVIQVIGFFNQNNRTMMALVHNMSLEAPIGLIVFSVMFVVLSVLFTVLLIRPKEMSMNLLKAGDCLYHIRPGKDTQIYLRNLLLSYSLNSSIIILIMIVTPLIVGLYFPDYNQLFSLPFTVMILGSIVLSVMDEIRTRNIGRAYEKQYLNI